MTKEYAESILMAELEKIQTFLKAYEPEFEAACISVFPDHISLFSIGGNELVFHNAVKKEEAPKPEPESQRDKHGMSIARGEENVNRRA